jgi:hypothetical protein
MKESAELAFQYGPFFFSLLFLVSISRWAFRNYDAACKRTNPAAGTEEISTLKNTYIASFLVGTLLVLVSMVWWFAYRPQKFLFEGEIDSLDEYDNLQSDSERIFFRSAYQKAPFFEPILSQTAHFVIVGDKPFSQGEGYDFNLYKGSHSDEKVKRDKNILHVEYDPSDPSPTYVLDCCDENAHYRLKHKAKTSKSSLSTGIVYAASPLQDADPGKPKNPTASEPWTRRRSPAEVIEDPLADIGERSLAIQQLQQMDQGDIVRVLDEFSGDVRQDALVLTLLDLTRHSDKQLAFRASRLLATVDANQYIARRLVSNVGIRMGAERILFRVDKDTAKTILGLAKQKGYDSPKIEQDVETGGKTKVLVPTWLPSETWHQAGDWYFIRVKWKDDDERVRDCLTRLFHEVLISRRTLKQEADLMRQKNGLRYVYWDRDWVLAISDNIKDCGAGYAFVHPGQ